MESFRNDLYAGYKTSEAVPPPLLAQFPILETALLSLGVVVWPMVEFEADDALASAAAKAARRAVLLLPKVQKPVSELLEVMVSFWPYFGHLMQWKVRRHLMVTGFLAYRRR